MFGEMNKYCSRQREHALAKRFSSLGLKALLYEISLTPKPGLVDKFSNGSHADMNYQTFIDSSVAISQWFNELVYAGFAFRGNDYTKGTALDPEYWIAHGISYVRSNRRRQYPKRDHFPDGAFLVCVRKTLQPKRSV